MATVGGPAEDGRKDKQLTLFEHDRTVLAEALIISVGQGEPARRLSSWQVVVTTSQRARDDDDA